MRAAIRAHGRELAVVYLESSDNPRLDAVARYARDQGVPRVEVVGKPALERLSGGVMHQGVAAWARDLAIGTLEPLLVDPDLLGVVLDRIQDPQNFGAVLRSAVGLGATCVVWGEHASAPLGAATLRAAAGAAEFARLCRESSLTNSLGAARDAGISVIGLEAQGDTPLWAHDLRRPTLLVIGSEHSGMTPAIRRSCTGFARLVEPGAIESLNASVAAAIALYEAKRQRNTQT